MITTTAGKKIIRPVIRQRVDGTKKCRRFDDTNSAKSKHCVGWRESEMREILSNKKMMDSRASHTTAQSSEHYTRTSSCGASVKAPFSAYPTSPTARCLSSKWLPEKFARHPTRVAFMTCDKRRRIIKHGWRDGCFCVWQNPCSWSNLYTVLIRLSLCFLPHPPPSTSIRFLQKKSFHIRMMTVAF